MPDIEQLFQLNHFENKALLRLQLEVTGCVFHGLFKLNLPLSGHIQGREQVTDQPKEDWVVIRDNLGQVEVSESSHQHLIFRPLRISSLQCPGYNQNGLDGTETPVIMVLD